MTTLPWRVTLEVIQVLEALVGSLASSAQGVPRATIDADLLVALSRGHIPPLVERQQDTTSPSTQPEKP